MSDDLVPFEGGVPELPASDAEKLLSGEPLPADASEQARALSEVLAGLTAAGTPRELVGEKGALAAFRAAPELTEDPGRRVLTARRGVRVAVLAAVGSLALGGVAAAATTGSLPGPLQRAAHVFGAPAGDGQDDQGENQDDQGDGHTSSASPTASESPAPSTSETPSPKPSASGSANGVGPDATGPAAFGLCHAFADTNQSDSVAFRNLQKAAADKGLTVKAYCTVIIALGPGNHHESSNGSTAKHGQHGNKPAGHKHKGNPSSHAGGSSSGTS